MPGEKLPWFRTNQAGFSCFFSDRKTTVCLAYERFCLKPCHNFPAVEVMTESIIIYHVSLYASCQAHKCTITAEAESQPNRCKYMPRDITNILRISVIDTTNIRRSTLSCPPAHSQIRIEIEWREDSRKVHYFPSIKVLMITFYCWEKVDTVCYLHGFC